MKSELWQKRRQNIIDATNFREPDKVPVGIEVITWPYSYAGVRLDEIIGDPVASAEAYTKFLDDIEIDFLCGIGKFFPPPMFEALGSGNYVFAPDHVTIQHSQATSRFMETGDYELLIEDYHKYASDVFPKKYAPVMQRDFDEALEMVRRAARLCEVNMKTQQLIDKRVAEKDIVMLNDDGMPAYNPPVENMFGSLRSMNDMLVDLRRRTALVDRAFAAIDRSAMTGRTFTAPNSPAGPGVTGPDSYVGLPFACGNIAYHAAPFLSPAQFDKYWYGPFEHYMKPYAEKGVKFFLKGEGAFINTIDRYRSLPKGTLIVQLDEDDPFEVYDVIKDWGILCAGIRTSMLKYGTKQECLDYVKKCYDTFAPGGGFMFFLDKPLMSPNDAKTENLLAVYEFANSYGKKS